MQVLLYTRFWDQEKQQMLNQLTFKDPDSNVKDNTCTQTGYSEHNARTFKNSYFAEFQEPKFFSLNIKKKQ